MTLTLFSELFLGHLQRIEFQEGTWRTVTMETRAEFGMEADPIAASVAVMATTTTFPGDSISPFACNIMKNMRCMSVVC